MPTEAQLNDHDKISDGDIATSLRWYVDAQQCALPAMESLAQISPDFQQYFVDVQRETTDIINEIVTTRPMFGQINQRLLALKTWEKAAAKTMAENLRNSLAARHQEELQGREIVAQQVMTTAASVALSLATRQTVLIYSQRTFVAQHPQYSSIPKIKAVQCKPAGKSLSCSLA
jgi:hypothetical protein